MLARIVFLAIGDHSHQTNHRGVLGGVSYTW